MMNKVTLLALFAFCSPSVLIAEPSRVVLNKKSGSPSSAYLVTADAKNVRYIDNPNDKSESSMPRSEIQSIFFYRPSSFNNGLESYKQGKFDEAKVSFQTCQEEYKALKPLPGNYSTRAAFYEMECARRSGDLDTLNSLLNSFRPDALTNENYITQLSIYPFWNAVRSSNWAKLESLAGQWEKKKLPSYQRAQVSYCHALALQAEGKEEEALLKFSEVLALSSLKEIEIVENAGEKIIEMILAKPGVGDARKKSGSEQKPSDAYYQLIEAASVARLWNSFTTPAQPLPAKYKDLLSVK